MIIVCPDCGRVTHYRLLVRCAKSLIFDENKEPDGETEEVILYQSVVPRCFCGKKVKFLEGENED